jgi:glycerol-1-phosphate dehydrogenase [NAD(P)+]
MDTLERLLAGTFPDPATGTPVPAPACRVTIAPDLSGAEAELVTRLGFGGTLAVVSDPDTDAAMGARVRKALSKVRVVRVDLPAHPHPDKATAEAIGRETAGADALVAVGSGTINDLCKFAAARAGKPYAVFATAPSMNGYASMNASITVGGLKRTLPARAPAGVFIDLRVLAAAPPRLIRAGVGDTICRSTAQADWLLAHLLRSDRYTELPFALLAEEEPRLLEAPEALLGGDLEAMAALARALVLAGFGMTLCGGSYSTSQGEHLISHYMELLHPVPPGGEECFHGEQIGVTTITMARLQEDLLAMDSLRVEPCPVPRADLLGRFGSLLGPSCEEEFAPKRLDAGSADALNARLRAVWPDVRGRIGRISVGAERIRSVLSRLGAPVSPRDLGWSAETYGDAVAHAAELRNRFTFLDIARDARARAPGLR